jgi:tetratricopeptide (TPR) repeat protein
VFVGRDGELERLRQLWKEAVAGERRLGLLGGEPGIGKTRLAAELASGLHAEGAVVLAGRCDEDLGVPYQPFVEALRHYVTHAGAPRLGRHGGELIRLVPEVAQIVPRLGEPLRSDPETERYRLFDAVTAWLGDVSAETPVLLVLDDLQWAAKPTLLLLRHVLRSSESLRLLVLVTYRDTDVGRTHPLGELLSDVRRVVGWERIPLAGIDVPGVAAYLEQVAGHDLDEEGEELARVLWRETEGNPFFVAEVLRHFAESGALERRDGRWGLSATIDDLGIPEGVRDVIGRRLSRLSEEANRVLACAAVIGLEFEPSLIQTAGAFPEDVVLCALEEAVATRLVIDVPGPAPRNRFSHALVRATLYDELTAARRVSLHRRVAEAIETAHGGALDDHLPALAHHWARAAAPTAETSRAVDYAIRAGRRALAQLAYDEAASYYRQALELRAASPRPVEDHEHLELLIALGDALRRAGDPVSREVLLEAVRLAQAAGDSDALARAALANTRTSYYSSSGIVDEDRVAGIEAALTAIGDTDTAVRARLMASLSVELVFTPQRERRVRLSDEALRIARLVDDPATLAHVLTTRFFAVYAPRTLVERQAVTGELLIVAKELGDPLVEFVAHWVRVRVDTEAGDMSAAAGHLQRAEALAVDLGQPTLRWMAGWAGVGPALLAGRFEDADRRAQVVYELGRASGQPDAEVYLMVHQFVVRFEQARLAEMEPVLRELEARLPGVPGALLLLAECYCETGRPDEARPILERLAAQFFALPEDPTWHWLLLVAADVARQLHHDAAAAVLFDLLAPYATMFSATGGTTFGCTDYYLAMLATTLGRFDDADARFASVSAVYEWIGAPSWLGYTRIEWARMLLARRGPGDTAGAEDLLGQALTSAEQLGLPNVERRARALLEKAQ